MRGGGGTVIQPFLASCINAFNSLAVPFFFIAAGYFFFNRIESLDGLEQKKGYAKKYLLKTIKIFLIWSVALLPSRIILSENSILVAIIKWVRVLLFIGDAQLWYLNALVIGLLLILLLQKVGLSDKGIMTLSTILFAVGILVQRQLDIMEISGYTGVWKVYHLILGSTIKNGFFMGMFYCMIGKILPKLCEMRMKMFLMVALFAIYIVGVYYQYSWRIFLLPIVSLFAFWSIMDVQIDLGKSSKWFRSMSTLLFLCHYIFVRAFECIPSLAGYFPEGIHKFLFVSILAFVTSAGFVFAGDRVPKIKWLWQ